MVDLLASAEKRRRVVEGRASSQEADSFIDEFEDRIERYKQMHYRDVQRMQAAESLLQEAKIISESRDDWATARLIRDAIKELAPVKDVSSDDAMRKVAQIVKDTDFYDASGDSQSAALREIAEVTGEVDFGLNRNGEPNA